jgi:hypothetical protein
MKRAVGTLLMIGGAILLYLFVARTMFAARDLMGSAFEANLPIRALDRDYPTGVLLLLGAVWGFILGIGLVVAPEEGVQGGRVARVMLLNALLLFSSLFAAYIGGKSKADGNLVAVFGLIALAQSLLGFFLLVFAIFEKPKGVVSLMLGAPLYLAGVGVTLYTLLVLGGGK